MLDARILSGAAIAIVIAVALAVFFGRRLASRPGSLEVPPVSPGWLAERRRIREELFGS
jgi:hypothetical protein